METQDTKGTLLVARNGQAGHYVVAAAIILAAVLLILFLPRDRGCCCCCSHATPNTSTTTWRELNLAIPSSATPAPPRRRAPLPARDVFSFVPVPVEPVPITPAAATPDKPVDLTSFEPPYEWATPVPGARPPVVIHVPEPDSRAFVALGALVGIIAFGTRK